MIETPAGRVRKVTASVQAGRRGGASAQNSDSSTLKVRATLAGRYSEVTGPHASSWELVQRIASSRRFGRSTLLGNFLLFVTHRSLTGDAAEINEQQIGVHVFGREEQFNRSDDNIVRTYARMLRKRLEDYFRNEGRDELLIVSIPRGSYVPIFTERTNVELEAAPETAQTDEIVSPAPAWPLPAPSASRVSRHLVALGGFALVLISITAALAFAHVDPAQWIRAQTPTSRLNHRFWSQIFEANRDTYLVPADGGLVMLESFLPKHVSLTDYANGTYKDPEIIRKGLISLTGSASGPNAVPLPPADLPSLIHKVEVLSSRRYSSVVDLELTSQFSRLPEVVPQRLMIRYARDLRMDDLRTGNLILMGSADSNPWADIFQPQLNFQFVFGAAYGGSPVIVNLHRLSGERSTYGSEDSETAHRSYGVIAYLPNLGLSGGSGTSNAEAYGHVILIEGVNMAGTQAAGAFLLSPDQMRPVLEFAIGPNGTIRPFEVLLDTSNIAANSARAHVLGERIISN